MSESIVERARRKAEERKRAAQGGGASGGENPNGNVESTTPTDHAIPTFSMPAIAAEPVEFVTGEEVKRTRTLHVAGFGAQRSGKTRFAFTILDILDPKQKIFLAPLDKNSMATFLQLEDELGLRGRVYYPKHELYSRDDISTVMRYKKRAGVLSRRAEASKTAAEKQEEIDCQTATAVIYRRVINRVVDYVDFMTKRGEVGGGCVDTFTELYEFTQLGDFGKIQGNDAFSWASINRELQDLINMCKGVHLHLIHGVREEYRKNPRTQRTEGTGRFIIDGWKNVGKSTSVVVEHLKIDDLGKNNALRDELNLQRVNGNEENDPLPEIPFFVLRPFESQANPWLNRTEHYLLNEDCTFAKLGEVVYGDEKWWKG